MIKAPEVQDMPKLSARWEQGAWFGKTIDDDEHVVATAGGVRHGRSCRALWPGEGIADPWKYIRYATWGETSATPGDAMAPRAEEAPGAFLSQRRGRLGGAGERRHGRGH
eukprot:14530966-Heterocapsa_arctica.AAC.1